MDRVCNTCGKSKDDKHFGKTGGGYRRRICNTCKTKRFLAQHPGKKYEYAASYRKRHPSKMIVVDCRASDKKHGFDPNDLDADFVAVLVKDGCTYCGEQSMRITLDRLDNSKGHMRNNVVACCLRCNYVKGSMPQEAWEHIVPAVRSAREKGLFGNWRTVSFNRKYK
jgi:hypothetical protein